MLKYYDTVATELLIDNWFFGSLVLFRCVVAEAEAAACSWSTVSRVQKMKQEKKFVWIFCYISMLMRSQTAYLSVEMFQ